MHVQQQTILGPISNFPFPVPGHSYKKDIHSRRGISPVIYSVTHLYTHSAHPKTSPTAIVLTLTPASDTAIPTTSTTSSTTAAVMKRGPNTRYSIRWRLR